MPCSIHHDKSTLRQKNARLQFSANNISIKIYVSWNVSIKIRHLEDQKNAGKYRRPRLRYNIVQTGAAARTCEDLHIFLSPELLTEKWIPALQHTFVQ